MLAGHTRDLSATGASLVVPSLSLAGRDFQPAIQSSGASYVIGNQLVWAIKGTD